MRTFHKLRGYGSLTFPRHIIAVDTETSTIKPSEETHFPQLILGHAIYISLDESLNILVYEPYDFYTVQDFWGWVSTKCYYKTELYMFAHNWGFDFPVLHGFDEIKRLGYTITMLVDESPPVILKFQRTDHKITILDTLNYFRQSLASMGSAIGLDKIEIDLSKCEGQELLVYCRRDTEIVAKSVVGLCRFLYSNKLSRLTPTVASLALSVFTNCFMKHDIMLDADVERNRLSRKSYLGGRTEAFRIGSYKGKYYLIDVNSMYPFVMRNHDFPTRVITTCRTMRIDELDVVTSRYAITAECRVNTNIPVYPKRINGYTCFPVGRFDTVLSTPEIVYGLDNDLIESLGTVILHEQARIFQDYVDYMYVNRQQYKKAKNESYQEFCKKLMNSLYGKFGQNGKKWKKTQLTPRGKPGSWEVVDRPTDNIVKYKEINDVVFEGVEDEEADHSFPAIAAHVTAYGRILLQRMIDYLGRQHVYYCDTDSLLIDQHAYDRVKSKLSPTVLGCWSLDGEYDKITINGLKDYQFGEKVKIKGINKKAVKICEDLYDQMQFSSLKSAINRGHLNSPVIKNVIKELTRVYNKGNVGADGIVTPFVLSAD